MADDSKTCLRCGKPLIKTIAYQGKWIHRKKTEARWQKKVFCSGVCFMRQKSMPVNYAGFV